MSDPLEELGQFFDTIYGDQVGYAYSPTKVYQEDGKGKFTRYFFQWPYQREDLVAHCLEHSGSVEVYYSPALFSREGAEKEDFLGSNFVWCDFDGNAPVDLQGIPEPTIKIQSSDDKNQHWYWKLDHFEKDISVVENISQRITYQGEADLGAWNANRVLRPPLTVHQESAKLVSVLRWGSESYAVPIFGEIPELPLADYVANAEDFDRIPGPIEVIAKYPWTREDFLFFSLKELPPRQTSVGELPGDRSGALTKLGHICVELGMSNSEAFAILLHADNKWGKFKGQRRQKKMLISIINYCRSKHAIAPVEQEVDNPYRVFSWDEFRAHDVKIDWAVRDLIHKKGILTLNGPPGVGKSQLTLRFMEAMAKGQDFLKWKIDKPSRMLFLSLEMPHEEIDYFLNVMQMEETDIFRENVFIFPFGSTMSFLNVENQARILDIVRKVKPDGIIIDSLGAAVGGNISDDEKILKFFHFLKFQIARQFGCFFWIIHHPRKGQVGNKINDKLDDLFGSTYIAGQSTTVMSLFPKTGSLELTNPKLRMAPEFKPLKLRRTPNLDFKSFEGLTMSKETANASVEEIFGGLGGLGDSI
jgi:hypothetical protein